MAAEAQDASRQSSVSIATQGQRATGANQQADVARSAASDVDAGEATAADGATANAVRSGAGSSSSSAGKASSMPMQDCSNDDSGLPLASLKVEAAWESHGLREDSDITIVTQMSPRRSAERHLRILARSHCVLNCPRSEDPALIR